MESCIGESAFPHGLFWLILKGATASPAIITLIETAKAKGITAEIIEIETFDSLLSRIWRHLPSVDPALDAKVRRASRREVNIPIAAAGTKNPILRTNALPLTLPKFCLRLAFKKTKEWDELKEALSEATREVAITKTEVIMGWGLRYSVKEIFRDELTDIDDLDVSDKMAALDANLYMKSMTERAICLALRKNKPLLYRKNRGQSFLIADNKAVDQSPLGPLAGLVGKTGGVVPGLFTTPTEEHPERQQIAWAECVEISIEQRDGRCWLLVQPNVWIWPKHGRRYARDFLDQRRGDRFNAKADNMLSVWLALLLPSDARGTDVSIRPFDGGSEAENPTFVLNNRTAYSRRLT
jgi:hypothetical protein